MLRLESRVTAASPVQDLDDTPRPGRASHQLDSPTDAATTRENGKLLSAEGDTRYVTSSLWADLEEADQIERSAVAEPIGPSSSAPSNPPPDFQGQHTLGLMLGLNPSSFDLRQLHPSESRIFVLWQTFLESVDPLLKIFHVPVTQRQLFRAVQNLVEVPPAFECLMFSIYYAAVTSLQSSVSPQTLPKEERDHLLARYRFGLEQALAKANFLGAPDMLTLQALTLYLVCAKQTEDKTYIWTMTGLAIRLATKLGLHRDPETLGLSPFISEIRRRLWWNICVLDVRTAEDNDMDPSICEHSFDTKFPANVHDSDLDVNMTQPAVESPNRTEMLFSLARCEIVYSSRKLLFSPKFAADNGYPNLSLLEKNKLIESVQNEINEKYLKQQDMTIPICFLTATSGRMVLAKIKLAINHPARTGMSGLSQDQFVDLVQSSLEIIEDSHTLRSSDKYSRWVWLFQKYVEWDAVAFLLHSLSIAPLPHLVERAWNAVDTFFKDWRDHNRDGERRWRRLESLRAKAAARRSPQNPSSQGHVDHLPNSAASRTTSPVASSTNHSSMAVLRSESGMQIGRDSRAERGIMTGQGTTLPTSTTDYVEWNFDTVPFAMQGAPSWEMDVDESAFNLWT